MLSLSEAIEKMTLMPAKRLEKRAPIMKQKGRIQIGAHADITIFNPALISDLSTYQNPSLASKGVEYLLIMGKILIDKGNFNPNIYPGEAIRAPKQRM